MGATCVLALMVAGCVAGGGEGWQGDCRFVEQRCEWHKLGMTVPTRSYKMIRLYLRLQMATGTVWFDRVEAPELRIANPSFEEVKGNDIVGWGQDDVGKTIFSDATEAYDGGRSVRICRDSPGMSRIWQDLAVQPKSRYKIYVWAKWEGIKGGHGYGEVYGINPDGSHGAILTSTPRLSGTSRTIVERWWEMKAQPDRATQARWELPEVEPGTYEIVTRVDTSRLRGTLTLSLASGGHTAAALTVKQADGWQTLDLVGKVSGRAWLKAAASGEGTARLEAVQFQHLAITPTPQQVKWLGPENNFRIGKSVAIVVADGAGGRELTGPQWLAREIGRLAGERPKIVHESAYNGGPAIFIGGKLAQQKLKAAGVAVPQQPEGYAVAVRRGFVAGLGSDGRGTFYAAVTLLSLLQRLGETVELAAADIVDWPDLPFRGTYGLYGGDPLVAAEACARLKLNAVLIESGDYYHLGDERVRQRIQRTFETLRLYWIDPIPELQSFGHGGAVLSVDPRCVEGEWIRNERHVLRGERPVELKRRDVIVTDATRIVVTSADGKTRYEEGRDFRVIPGETKFPFSPKHKPWRIVRMAGGRIRDGETVLVSYDCAPKRGSSYCPNEPIVYRIMGEAIRNTMRYLKPRWLHVGHDEIYRMNTDSRCRRAGRSNAENLAMELKRLLGFAREVNPRVQIMLWADMLNPYHNGKRLHSADPCFKAAELLPREDFIMNVWFYGGDQPPAVGWKSLKWFDELGFATTGSPWYNHRCAGLWGDVCVRARRAGMKCLGALYTSWSNRWDALATMAEHAWHGQAVRVAE